MRRITNPLLGLVFSVTAGAQAQVPQINWRYDEDWSTVAARDMDGQPWWLPAKHQPLDAKGDIYLSSGLEARARFEGFSNNGWGGGPAPDDGYLWLRVLPHVDLHAGPARAFVQLIGGYARGVEPEKGGADETGLDVQQAFADLRVPLGHHASLTLRGGRELIAFGSERLVGLRYGPNIPQPFDGGRATLQWGGTRVEMIDVKPVDVGIDDFDDRTSRTERLRGVYLISALPGLSSFDAYVLDYHNDDVSLALHAGREHRQTYGVRVFGSASGWSWNWEAMLQRGHLGATRIRAWSLATETAYKFAGAPLAPAIRLRANIASGDKARTAGRTESFNPMFPKGKYFGELSPIGPVNIINIHPSVSLELGHGMALDLAAVVYWRASRGDGLYDLPGQLIRAPGTSRARSIGTQAEVLLTWQATQILSFSASCSLFEPGAFIRQSGPARTIRMVGAEALFRF